GGPAGEARRAVEHLEVAGLQHVLGLLAAMAAAAHRPSEAPTPEPLAPHHHTELRAETRLGLASQVDGGLSRLDRPRDGLLGGDHGLWWSGRRSHMTRVARFARSAWLILRQALAGAAPRRSSTRRPGRASRRRLS